MLVNLVLLAVFVAFVYHHFVSKRRDYPPGPTPLPLLGNVHQVGVDINNLGKVLAKMGEQFGGMFTIWYPTPMVIISDYDIMKEALLHNGDALSGRPDQYLFSLFAEGHYGLVYPDGWFWREQRRFALHVLRDFGFGRNIMEEKINIEIDRFCDHINDLISKSENESIQIDHEEPIMAMVASVIGMLTFGHRYNMEFDGYLVDLKRNIDNFVAVFTSPASQLLNLFPWLRHVPLFNHFNYDVFRKILPEFLSFYKNQIEEHKQKLKEMPDHEPEDYTDAYLQEMNKHKENGKDVGSFSEWQLLMAVADLWGAGMETTVTTLRWMVRYMTLYPEVQDRVYSEIISVLGHEQRVSMSDKSRMPYITAALHELQRIANILPLNLMHETMQDVTINGLELKKGTTVIPQISAVMSDEKYFPQPDEYRPERFLTADNQIDQSLVEKVVPFGMGKRQCLGESLARMELFMMFVTILQKFKFSLTPEEQRKSRDQLLKTSMRFTRAPMSHDVIISRRK